MSRSIIREMGGAATISFDFDCLSLSLLATLGESAKAIRARARVQGLGNVRDAMQSSAALDFNVRQSLD